MPRTQVYPTGSCCTVGAVREKPPAAARRAFNFQSSNRKGQVMKNFHSHIRLKGLTAENPAYAGQLLPAYQDALSAVAAYTYRSLIAEEQSQELSGLFDRLSTDALRQFQTLGELILAFGGNPVIYTPLRTATDEGDRQTCDNELLSRFLQDSIREERSAVERCETLLGKTDDRVVRSVLMQLLREKQAHLCRLKQASAS